MEWIDLKRQEDLLGENLDGYGHYQIINPTSLYCGKSYSDWTTDWVNWFLSADADRRNSGPVVFVRSKGLPDKKTGPNISESSHLSGYSIADDDSGTLRSYTNDPNIRIGGDKLHIFEDQAVFVPIIVAFTLKANPIADWGSMQDTIGSTIDCGDNPPDNSQLSINGRPLSLAVPDDQTKGVWNPSTLLLNAVEAEKLAIDKARATLKKMAQDGKTEKEIQDAIKDEKRKIFNERKKQVNLVREHRLMESFRVATPVFTAIVPEAPYGRSAKDFIEEAPVAAGIYPAMADGYFVMLKFQKGTYWVHSWASAPRESRGPYFSELLYQIEVHAKREISPTVSKWRPSGNYRVFKQILEQDEKTKELTDVEKRRLLSFLDPLGTD